MTREQEKEYYRLLKLKEDILKDLHLLKEQAKDYKQKFGEYQSSKKIAPRALLKQRHLVGAEIQKNENKLTEINKFLNPFVLLAHEERNKDLFKAFYEIAKETFAKIIIRLKEENGLEITKRDLDLLGQL